MEKKLLAESKSLVERKEGVEKLLEKGRRGGEVLGGDEVVGKEEGAGWGGSPWRRRRQWRCWSTLLSV